MFAKSGVLADLFLLFEARWFFKALALWADAFYKLKCPYVCLFVCLFTFEVPFNGLFAPTSRSRMSNNLEIRNSWGKVMERSGVTFKHFCLEVV